MDLKRRAEQCSGEGERVRKGDVPLSLGVSPPGNFLIEDLIW